MKTAEKIPSLEQQLHCFGYFGFGGGYVTAEGVVNYCTADCPRSKDCWKAHRERCRQIAPELMLLMDRIFSKEQIDGTPEAAQLAWRTWGGIVGKDEPTPDIFVMAGNLEDGASVAATGKPRDREQWTLPWPFK